MNKVEAIDVVQDAGFGFLATIDENNKPRVRPMMPYLAEDGRLLLAMLGRSRSIADIKHNPNVEFCFVDRKMWYCRISGEARISDDKDKKETLWNGIPMLRQYFAGPADPNFVMAEVQVTGMEAMTPHQKLPDVFDGTI